MVGHLRIVAARTHTVGSRIDQRNTHYPGHSNFQRSNYRQRFPNGGQTIVDHNKSAATLSLDGITSAGRHSRHCIFPKCISDRWHATLLVVHCVGSLTRGSDAFCSRCDQRVTDYSRELEFHDSSCRQRFANGLQIVFAHNQPAATFDHNSAASACSHSGYVVFSNFNVHRRHASVCLVHCVGSVTRWSDTFCSRCHQRVTDYRRILEFHGSTCRQRFANSLEIIFNRHQSAATFDHNGVVLTSSHGR